MIEEKNLKWRFDVNAFRLFGRDLITDRITAVYELVKNCYDANATSVVVSFENVGANASGKPNITISDDGHGMSFNDVRDKWMVVGTASKRNKLFSDKPFNRRYVGEKGIGRFAVDKLGGKLTISTKQKGEKERLIVKIDWDAYEVKSRSTQLTLFTDIENGFFFEEDNPEIHGTTLSISSIAELWTEPDIKRLERELEKIVSPFYPLDPPFNIYIQSNEYSGYENRQVKAETIKYSSHQFSINFNLDNNIQETLKFDNTKNQIIKQQIPIQIFGPVHLELYYFNEAAKKRYNSAYKNDDYRVDGVKIYRDGLITTPFAEFESERDKKRDILGIDKRLWSGTFDKIGTREIIGILDITKDSNPQIIEATNRQDFVDNREYRELKEFVISQLRSIAELKKYERYLIKVSIDKNLARANIEIKEFTTRIETLERKNPTLEKILKPLREQAISIDRSIKKGIQQQERERKDHIRKENIYLSLMSLQDYAIHISHAVRTALGKVKRMAEFFKERYPNPELDTYFREYSVGIYDEMTNLSRIIDFMLSYAGSTIDMEDFNIKTLLVNLFEKSYSPVFQAESIHSIIEIQDSFIIHANRKFFEDIIENLISNSIKALRNENNKIIKCAGYIDIDKFVVVFSDNGEGIKKENEERIFEMYYTTTADLGGAGLGLYIVKTRVESLNGSISLIKSEFFPKGASFKIVFPLRKTSHEVD
ncbi:ATP-binding protein [Persicitalea jodogahamensis]|uniref:histidine kinase n=1 Tax=Persicitalea jodogahamensis TaxID=402147 RepID=A0A8J3DAM7_9BACT|nr:sensor histidine kinase [Persicitalea jodogahamensis]GHB83102.1 hypothetical protein GCM10007390_42570 [Persicitalea jodogahamensis]